IARKHDVVEDEQPGRGVVAEPADIGGQRVGRRKVSDRAIAVDVDLGRRDRVNKSIDHAASIGNAIDTPLRLRRGSGQEQVCEGNKKDPDPAAAPSLIVPLKVMYALVPITKRFVARRDRGSPRYGLDSGGPAVVEPRRPVRPVTLRRHLSMALPLSESR